MRAGKLNSRVYILSRQKVKGGIGGTTEVLTPLDGPVWAGIKHTSSAVKEETTKVGGEITETTTEITIRYRPGLAPQMVVAYGLERYRIVFVNNWEERNRFLILKCVNMASDDE